MVSRAGVSIAPTTIPRHPSVNHLPSSPGVEAPPPQRPAWRRRLRWGIGVVVSLGAAHALAWSAGMTKLSTPGDIALNLGTTRHEPTLTAPTDGRCHLVVVLHGVGRSAWSMWKIERLLEQHGYEVWNVTYDGANTGLLDLGADLERRLERYLERKTDTLPVLYGVAHSMGGLVLRSYAARPQARAFAALVFLGTPNQGSTLAAQLADTWYFRLVLGDAAAADLTPARGVVASLGPAPPNLGNVIGAASNDSGRSSRIPGDDDGRVGVHEAHLDGETDSVTVDLGHTFLSTDDLALHHALYFLRHLRFDPSRAR